MVESAIVFPLVIVFSVLCTAVMFFYSDAVRNTACMSICMRSASGAGSKTVCCAESGIMMIEQDDNWDISEKRHLQAGVINTTCQASLQEKKIFGFSAEKKIFLEHSCINEAECIWKKQLMEEIRDG